jgi:hypothetical protein
MNLKPNRRRSFSCLTRPKLMDPLVKETDELVRIFVRSIQTAEQRKR